MSNATSNSVTFACSLLIAAALPAGSPLPADDAPPPSPITVSAETTVLVEPLTPEGYVDYFSALNARHGEGVVPEQNATAYLLRLFGPNGIREAEDALYFEKLGVPLMPPGSGALTSFDKFGESQGIRREEWYDVQRMQEEAASSGPWTEESCPLVAKWLEHSEAALKLIDQALAQPDCYSPLVPGNDGSLVGAVLRGLSNTRHAAKLLVIRAMRRLADRDIQGCWSDLMGLHRLARMVGQPLTILHALMVNAIDTMACRGHAALCEFGALTPEQATTMLSEFDAIRPRIGASLAFHEGERFLFLDAYTQLVRARFNSESFFEVYDFWEERGGEELARQLQAMVADGVEIDWDEPLRLGNQWYDRVSAAFGLSDRNEWIYWTGRMQEDREAMQLRCNNPDRMIRRLKSGTPVERGQIVGEMVLTTLGPDVKTIADGELRIRTKRQLTRVAFLLAAYRAARAHYPQELAELNAIAEESDWIDPFTGNPFVYRPENSGFICYSLGANGRDDAGVDHGIQYGIDDQSIRVPSASQ